MDRYDCWVSQKIGDTILWPILDKFTSKVVEGYPKPEQVLCWCLTPQKQDELAIKLNAKPEVGDLVVVSHWADFDYPNDAVELGLLREIKDGYYYINDSKRGYKHCRLVYKKGEVT